MVSYYQDFNWKKDKHQILQQIPENAGVKDQYKNPPDWILNLFKNYTDIIAGNFEFIK